MSRSNGLDFRNALETETALMFHFLYAMSGSETPKLRDRAFWEEEFAPVASRYPFRENGNLISYEYLYLTNIYNTIMNTFLCHHTHNSFL